MPKLRIMKRNKLLLMVLALAACTQVPPQEPPVKDPSETPVETPSQDPSGEPVPPGELLADIVFQADGKAADNSSNQLTVNTVKGPSLMTCLQTECQEYVPRFYPDEPGASTGTSFYRVRYDVGGPVPGKLADGHSLSCLLMCDFDPARIPTVTVSAFSGLERAGSGIYVRKTICFDVVLQGEVVSIDSGLVPERGTYYQVVGVFDPEREEARLYVDGALKGRQTADKPMSLPTGKATAWYGIGVDTSPSGLATGAWRGELVRPQIYDQPLTDAQVAALYADMPHPAPYTMDIRKPDYLTGIALRPGSAFRLFAEGLQAGDKLLLKDEAGWKELAATYHDGYLEATVTKELTGPEYDLLVGRGTQVCPVGSLGLTVSPEADEPRRPTIVAHRGWWLSKAVPQNSLAALKAAQDGGCEAAEMDIWITRDGGVFVNHDGTLDGVRIETSDIETVSRLKLTNGETIPTLDAYLDQHALHPQTTLIIEIKQHSRYERTAACVDAALEAVRAHGLESSVQYISFDLDACKRIAAARPQAMVGYLTGDCDPLTLKQAGIMQLDYQPAAFLAHPDWVKTAHDNGMLVNLWTLDTEEDLRQGIALGADMLTTNYPERVQTLQQRFFD